MRDSASGDLAIPGGEVYSILDFMAGRRFLAGLIALALAAGALGVCASFWQGGSLSAMASHFRCGHIQCDQSVSGSAEHHAFVPAVLPDRFLNAAVLLTLALILTWRASRFEAGETAARLVLVSRQSFRQFLEWLYLSPLLAGLRRGILNPKLHA